MAGCDIHREPPYWAELAAYAGQRVPWRRLDGFCLSRGVDIWTLPADRCYNLIEFWLEESAVQTKEENDARENVSLQLTKIQARIKRAKELGDDYVDDRAPHLRG